MYPAEFKKIRNANNMEMHFFKTLIFIDLNKNRGIINKLKTNIREHAINPGQFYKSLY